MNKFVQDINLLDLVYVSVELKRNTINGNVSPSSDDCMVTLMYSLIFVLPDMSPTRLMAMKNWEEKGGMERSKPKQA